MFSGTGTYTLNISNGDEEEYMFPDTAMRECIMQPGVYVEVLEKFGWFRKQVR